MTVGNHFGILTGREGTDMGLQDRHERGSPLFPQKNFINRESFHGQSDCGPEWKVYLIPEETGGL